MEKARLVCSGGQQFVILPEEFRFSGSEVAISRDGITGVVVLSAATLSWSDFDETAMSCSGKSIGAANKLS